jgi:hypothetical protein
MRFFCIGLRCFAFKVAPNVENDRGTINMTAILCEATWRDASRRRGRVGGPELRAALSKHAFFGSRVMPRRLFP